MELSCCRIDICEVLSPVDVGSVRFSLLCVCLFEGVEGVGFSEKAGGEPETLGRQVTPCKTAAA